MAVIVSDQAPAPLAAGPGQENRTGHPSPQRHPAEEEGVGQPIWMLGSVWEEDRRAFAVEKPIEIWVGF